jgi:hypothetical protein
LRPFSIRFSERDLTVGSVNRMIKRKKSRNKYLISLQINHLNHQAWPGTGHALHFFDECLLCANTSGAIRHSQHKRADELAP